MSDSGRLYAAACRRILSDLKHAEATAAGVAASPRGTLTLTAPVFAGEAILRPIISRFIDAYPAVNARLVLANGPLNLSDDDVDIALRIANLPDSSLIAVRVGEVRRVIVGAPSYLSSRPPVQRPDDLAGHRIIAMTHFGTDSWSFPPLAGSTAPRIVHFTPRLLINSMRGAISAAIDGQGLTRVFSFSVSGEVRAGKLQVVLKRDEPPPCPVHLICANGHLNAPKVRAFVDFAAPRLRSCFRDQINC